VVIASGFESRSRRPATVWCASNCARDSTDSGRLHNRTEQARALQSIRRGGGRRHPPKRRYVVGYFLPTDFAGPNNEGYGLIDFDTLASYEQYRHVLAEDPGHKKNTAELEQTGAIVAMNRSIIERVPEQSLSGSEQR
jgi:hypothetical protein